MDKASKNFFACIGVFCCGLAMIGIFLSLGCESKPVQSKQTNAPPPNYRMQFLECQAINKWGQVSVLRDTQTEQDFVVVTTYCFGEGAPGVAIWPLMPGKAVNKKEENK